MIKNKQKEYLDICTHTHIRIIRIIIEDWDVFNDD